MENDNHYDDRQEDNDNNSSKLLGVTLQFLQNLLQDNRLRRPVHKLGAPTTSLETAKLPQLQLLARNLRVHSDLSPIAEFARYEDANIERKTWVDQKNLKRVPSTSTHVFECVVKKNLASFHRHEQQHYHDTNLGSFAELIIQSKSPNDVGPATDYVIHTHSHRFCDLVDALTAHEEHLDESAENGLAPITTRFYYIDIFCEPPINVDQATTTTTTTTTEQEDEKSRNYIWETKLCNTMQSIGSTLLILGSADMIGIARDYEHVQLATHTTRVVWCLYLTSISSVPINFQVCFSSKDVRGIEENILSLDFANNLERFLTSTSIPIVELITTDGTIEEND